MLALIYVTVFLHLNYFCSGKSSEDVSSDDHHTYNGDVREVEVLLNTQTDLPVSADDAKAKGLIASAHIVNGAQENVGAHWPMGYIPYYFDAKSYDHIITTRFLDALNSVESSSCIKFKSLIVKPMENGTWIHVTNPNKQRECMHEPIVKETGEIVLVLGLDCLKRRDVLHTLLHAIGFKDEVCHPQRDQYVRILWENIHPGYRKLFRIKYDGEPLTEYDPMSIMHFHDRAFTVNGQATIAPLMSGLNINPSHDLSPLDKMKLRLLFSRECNRRKVGDLLDTCKNVLHKESKGEPDVNKGEQKQEKNDHASESVETADNPDKEVDVTTNSIPVSCGGAGQLACMPYPVPESSEEETTPILLDDEKANSELVEILD